MSDITSIHFLTFPNVSEQDLLVPWELFRALAWGFAHEGRHLDVSIGGFESGPVATHMGTEIKTNQVLEADDRFDVLYVPGGLGGGAASSNPEILELVRKHHAEGRWVASNCSGVGVLFRSGILDGKTITCSVALARRLPTLGADVLSPRLAWHVDAENRIFTSAGGGTAHMSTVALVAQFFGSDTARGLAANWDSLGLLGGALLQPDGPIMDMPAELAAVAQDSFEMVFLPD
ncbi:DJ-1/PfpI family protein [Ectopseudomonas khazarica]|uniref:DJ-1/PfpI family protein n=1 Tax=Ectopseudomonas khazarica TaxID=2502979 RepID=UPI003A8FC7F5